MPREIGLMFQPWGVRAIMLPPGTPGRKTQTRRLVKGKWPWLTDPGKFYATPWEDRNVLADPAVTQCDNGDWAWYESEYPEEGVIRFQVPLHVGDIMYVKETWRTLREFDRLKPRELPDNAPIRYTDGSITGLIYGHNWPCSRTTDGEVIWGKTRSPLFLQYRFARLRFPITRIRVQRLQEISPRDAYAEGVIPNHDPIPVGLTWAATVGTAALEAYHRAWDSINGPGSWDANPWVWVYEWE